MGTVSQTHTAATSSSNYQSIFDNALEAYKKKTNNDIRSHPLLSKLESCDSPDDILTVLHDHIPGSDQPRGTNEKLTKWLNPTVNVLSTFSAVIGGGIGLLYPIAGLIFTGIGILLSAAHAVSASQDALADVFDRIENFFRRMETYIEVPPTAGMMDIIIKIMVEVLSILAIVTKEIKQGRAKKFVKKLVGKNDIEDALGRLDWLTQEEVRMAAAQGLKVTHEVDGKVEAVHDKVQGIDDKVQDIDDKMQGVDDRMRDVEGVIITGDERIREEIRQVSNDLGDQKRNLLLQELRNWLSPPDPSVNYNTASDAHHEGTAAWFTESTDFMDWKSSGSLLWIYGKPGSGKSVLSSSIVRDIEGISNTGSAFMAYFFFDFKDKGKQDVRALLSSLIVQLCYQSHLFCNILMGYHSTHQSGSRQANDRTLTQCLEDMLRVPGQVPIYLIVDALDECPNTTGMPSSRDKVLALVEKLTQSNLPNLRLCITSRPEVDIRTSLEPLASKRVALHDQGGQKKDIDDFVNAVVHSDKNIRRWRVEDKNMVIEVLSERADGMFRWVFCQLERLRHCLPPSVRRILEELPESLDETYERILQEIPKSNQAHAHRLLQCLTVATRPLRVEELAEVLAVDFGSTGGPPKLDEDLRWEDQEQAVLFACSSLIAVVADGDSRVVQFSHFSVKEFLTSDRLATSKLDAFRYHSIRLEAAHTIMSQACLSVLLHLDPNVDEESVKKYPLAEYAADYFGDHAEFEGVFSHIRDCVDHLVDANKPHLATWLWVRTRRQYLDPQRAPRQLDSAPLYYVAELGLYNMVNYLISKRPEDLTVMGAMGTPLHAALYRRHANVAQLLAGHCVDVDIRNSYGTTPLRIATAAALPETVRILVERNADINARDIFGQTPLHGGAFTVDDRPFEVARFLLEHGADAHARDNRHRTPLHLASSSGSIKTVKLLAEHGADIRARDEWGRTPLHDASYTVGISLEDRYLGAIRLLLEHDADVDALDNDHCTPLYEATAGGSIKIVQLLLEHGTDIHVQNKKGQTPIHHALGNLKDRSYRVGLDAIRLLLRHGADVDALDNDYTTPLHVASHFGSVKATRLLLEYGASIQARDKKGQTPLHRVLDNMEECSEMEDGRVDATRFLLDHGADVDALDDDHSSPLHVASSHGSYKATGLLLEHGANIHMRNKNGETPFQVASGRGHQDIMQLLSEDGQDGQHPQHLPLAT